VAFNGLDESTLNLDFLVRRSARAPVSYSIAWIILLVLSDLVMFVLAAYIAGAIVDHNWSYATGRARFVHSSIIFVAVWIGMFWWLGLYRRSLALSFKDEFYFTVIALIFGVTPQLFLFTILPLLSTSRLVLLLSSVVAVALVGATRSALHLIRTEVESRRPMRLLVVGDVDSVSVISESLRRATDTNLQVMCIDPQIIAASEASSEEARAKFLLEVAGHWRCQQIILAQVASLRVIRRLLPRAESQGVRVAIAVPGLGLDTYGATVERRGNQELIFPVKPRICRPTAQVVKRIFDMMIAFMAVVACFPLLLLAGLGILLDSGVPILFSQERVGKGGRSFRMLKLRTMTVGAGSEWAKPGDDRITRFGALLRRTSIDELPQLINVLRGDMSLVGPRPEMKEFEERFADKIPAYAERRQALPGITGWAQVNIKRNLLPEDVEDVLEYDLFYIKHWSVFLDFTVLLKTAAEFLFHRAV
jgi:exopolysaccharide biosynthesis polyprenyl glycosylphosphotransferase